MGRRQSDMFRFWAPEARDRTDTGNLIDLNGSGDLLAPQPIGESAAVATRLEGKAVGGGQGR